MAKNLIFCAFAFKEGYETSLQTGEKAGSHTTQMYLENIFVALTSAKMYNPNDDVCLVSNCALPAEWQQLFAQQGILHRQVSYDTFEVPSRFPWALAFYKLCAMKAMVEQGGSTYVHYLLFDADTYTVRNYEELWREADYGVLLFPVGHSFNHPDRETIRRDFVKFFPEEAEKRNIVHYGGEFVAGRGEALKTYLKVCEQVYQRIRQAEYEMEPHAGDETVWSVAAALVQDTLPVTAAGAYLYRFWTGDFYLVATVTVSNPVCIWHIPNEKATGFRRLYRYYRKHGCFPAVEKAAAMFGIVKAGRPLNCYTLANKISGKLK